MTARTYPKDGNKLLTRRRVSEHKPSMISGILRLIVTNKSGMNSYTFNTCCLRISVMLSRGILNTFQHISRFRLADGSTFKDYIGSV